MNCNYVCLCWYFDDIDISSQKLKTTVYVKTLLNFVHCLQLLKCVFNEETGPFIFIPTSKVQVAISGYKWICYLSSRVLSFITQRTCGIVACYLTNVTEINSKEIRNPALSTARCQKWLCAK